MKTTTGLFSIVLAFVSVTISPQARAVCQEGCLTNNNTALGEDALINNSGSDNTAVGFNALFSNTTGAHNTATGYQALLSNTSGEFNTAMGYTALHSNTTGSLNTALGDAAMYNNTTGFYNTAAGHAALDANTTGTDNTAIGFQALLFNTTGSDNTAIGLLALWNNIDGNNNVALGRWALAFNTTGDNNIAVGANAGFKVTNGSNNIDIGSPGKPDDANKIRIGKQGTQTNTFIAGISGATVPTGVPVIVDTTGQLGTTTSSARFKEAIQPMDNASEAILALKPVTFHYKHELDPAGTPQFGLVAEDVEKVNPDLVARDEQGKPYTVRYEAVNAMLLNEFLKEHRKVERHEMTIAQQEGKIQEQTVTISELKKNIGVLTGQLKEQASQIQKVSAQLEAMESSLHVVLNNQ